MLWFYTLGYGDWFLALAALIENELRRCNSQMGWHGICVKVTVDSVGHGLLSLDLSGPAQWESLEQDSLQDL